MTCHMIFSNYFILVQLLLFQMCCVIYFLKVRADYKQYLGPAEFQLLPSDLNHVWKSGITMLLPRRDARGRAILYFRPGKP